MVQVIRLTLLALTYFVLFVHNQSEYTHNQSERAWTDMEWTHNLFRVL